MSTSTVIELPDARQMATSRWKALLLHVFCGSLALYPLLEQFIAPVMGVSFAFAAIVVGAGLLRRGLRMQRTFVMAIWAAMLVVYVTWSCVAIVHGNVPEYITQDSAGFLLYIGVMPVLYLLIEQNNLQRTFFHIIDRLSIAIAVLSVVVVIGYFAIFGEVETEPLLLTNAFLFGIGLSWKLDSNAGMLGLYTNIAHLMMLGSAMAMYRFSLTRRRRELLLVLLYLVGLLLDGRRALAICAFMQLVIAAPRLLAMVPPAQRLRLTMTAVALLMVTVVANLDWIQKRFEFTDNDISSAARYDQIPPLLDKIAEHPLIGGGFGTYAALIRSDLRPFSYEVDFLATIMKLGLLGGALYFGTYLLGVAQARRIREPLGLFLMSAGLPFFFYMGANGNQAMSTDSSMFHIFLFLMIAFALPPKTAAVCPTDPEPAAFPGTPAT